LGEKGRSLIDDLKQMPRLVVLFVWNPIRWVASAVRIAKISNRAAEPEAEIAA